MKIRRILLDNMSLPPYKHRRNPCLQTEDEPMIPGLAGAPLITHRSVQERRRTSDQRVARIRNVPGVEFEYEYVPTTQTYSGFQFGLPSKEKTILKPQTDDPHYQQRSESKTVNFKCVNEQGPAGPSGDQQDAVKVIGECDIRNNVVGKSENRKENLKDANDDVRSTCSRQSSVSRQTIVSHCSQSSRKTGSSVKSQKRSTSRESQSSLLKVVLKTPNRGEEKDLCFQRFGRIANGLDEDDLRPRRR